MTCLGVAVNFTCVVEVTRVSHMSAVKDVLGRVLGMRMCSCEAADVDLRDGV